MPVIDFHDPDQYDAAIAFLVGRGMAFHTSPPQRVIVHPDDYKALEQAKIVPEARPRANGSRGKKTRSSSKPKAGGAH